MSVSPIPTTLVSVRPTPPMRKGIAVSPSPAPGAGTSRPSSAASSKSSIHKQKPVNVFSDDGSFLERFQRMQKEDEEKKKHEDELERKRQFEERFKRRGKRRAPSFETETDAEPADDSAAKKAKVDSDKPTTAYAKEIKSYTGSLKDVGTGIRPLVK